MDKKFGETIYLDSAATTLTPKRVVDAYCSAFRKKIDIEDIRKKVASFLSVESSTIKFTKGTTSSLNKISNLFEGSKVVMPISEHHSNMLPWRKNNFVEYMELDSNGFPLLKSSDILSIAHVSNVLGTKNDIKQICSHNQSKVKVIDGAQYPSHYSLDLSDIDCDFYVFSGHKMYGPTGIGILYDKNNLIEESYNNEFALAGLAESLDYIEENRDKIKREEALTSYALEELMNIGVKIYGPIENRAPIISFSLEGIHSHDLGSFMSSKNIAMRVGHHCAQPLMDYLGVVSTARISFGLYNDFEDVNYFIKCLKMAIKFFS